MLALLNCSCSGWWWSCIYRSSRQSPSRPSQHSCQQQRCLSCSSQMIRMGMSLSSGLSILPKPPRFVTATKTIDLGSHIPWIICFSACEEMEKSYRSEVCFELICCLVSAGMPMTCCNGLFYSVYVRFAQKCPGKEIIFLFNGCIGNYK